MNWAVVMAGGWGTRFWPESRRRRPKPFLRLFSRRTLLEETVERLTPLLSPRHIFVVLQKEFVREAARLLPKIPRENLLGEPESRNTAPCAVFAAAQIEKRDPTARIAFLPADHRIEPKRIFQRALRKAYELADERPVLFGIRPAAPEPWYGYLEGTRPGRTRGGGSLFTVRRFHEKPSLGRARRFFRRKNFFWNSGIFVWRLDPFKRAVRKHAPRLYPAFRRLSPKRPGGSVPGARLARVYRSLPSVSLDCALMEKMKNVQGLASRFEWSDLGSWPGVSAFWPQDAAGNRFQGKAVFLNAKRNIVRSRKRLVALIGTDDLVVVDSEEALLVCPRSKTEEVREMVRRLERRDAVSS